MSLTRNQQHYIIMTVIYNELTDFNFAKNEVSRNALELASELCECEVDKLPDFIKDSINVSLLHYGEIVNKVSTFLVDWKWDRLPLLTQAIIIMSYTHFYYIEKVDKVIVIDVAVELAKKYIEEKQAKFINALLEKVLQ